jgi:hypothetical protein
MRQDIDLISGPLGVAGIFQDVFHIIWRERSEKKPGCF